METARSHPRANLIAYGWSRVAIMIGVAVGHTMGDEMTRKAIRLLRRYLRPTESMVRRLLILLADGVTYTPAPPSPERPRTRTRPSRPTERREPAFPLMDPWSIDWNVLSPPTPQQSSLPGMSLAGSRAPSQPPAEPRKPDYTEGLLRRLRVLKAVVDDPEPHIRRMARRLWLRDHAEPGPMRMSPVRPIGPPGQTRRLGRESEMALKMLDHAAREQLNRDPDTS